MRVWPVTSPCIKATSWVWTRSDLIMMTLTSMTTGTMTGTWKTVKVITFLLYRKELKVPPLLKGNGRRDIIVQKHVSLYSVDDKYIHILSGIQLSRTGGFLVNKKCS